MEKIEVYRDSRGDLHLTEASAERAEARYVLENEVNAYIRANAVCGDIEACDFRRDILDGDPDLLRVILFAARYHNLSI